MDLFMASRFFDTITFESFNFTADDWSGGDFIGQLKKADDFQTIYHRPTRKRMLFTTPDQAPRSSVIRAKTTQEMFIVGAHQADMLLDVNYRDTWALHKPRAKTTLYRTAPIGPANDPGWAVETAVETTFVDFELRSVNENEGQYLVPRGHYVATFPANSTVDRGDRVTVEGEDFWCVEAYWDSSMRFARMVNRPTHWNDVVYKKYTGTVYSGGKNTPTYDDYNVTLRLGPDDESQTSLDVNANKVKAMILTSWIGVEPSLDDCFEYRGRQYLVSKVSKDPLEDQWVLEARM